MCGLCEKSINWNYPHYPVVSDGLVFINPVAKYDQRQIWQKSQISFCKIF